MRIKKNIFQTIINGGKIFSTPFFLFYFTKNQQAQYAIVAPKKIFKTAVKRNKYRRMGYNILRSFPLKGNMGIFIYKKEALFATQKEIKESVFLVLKKTESI